ncbi:MAG: hypothetical protein JWO13_3788 [Acidobacteriales bacterium]|nr:hypothetical protein [Terriglobales bacterium]
MQPKPSRSSAECCTSTYLFCENRSTFYPSTFLTTGTFNLFVKDPNRLPPRWSVLSKTQHMLRVLETLSPYSVASDHF